MLGVYERKTDPKNFPPKKKNPSAQAHGFLVVVFDFGFVKQREQETRHFTPSHFKQFIYNFFPRPKRIFAHNLNLSVTKNLVNSLKVMQVKLHTFFR